MLFISTSQLETNAENADLEIWDDALSNETEESSPGPYRLSLKISPSIFLWSKILEAGKYSFDFFFLLKCKCQTEHIIYDTTVNDVCLRQNKFCHFPGQWCLQDIKGQYLEAMTRAVGAGPSSRVECRWMKRKGLRKQSSQVTRMNSLLSFNKITDELMSSLKSGKPDVSRILFWAPRILCFRFCLRH